MPRITPCRVLKLLALPWIIMLGLWFFLPSPTIPAGKPRTTYIQNTLAAGRALLTIHDWSPSFNKNHRGEMSECTTLLIRWQLRDSSSGDVLLEIGDHGTLNINGIIRGSITWNSDRQSNKTAWVSHFDNPEVLSGIAAGSTDHVINMPWFHTPDKHLFHHEMYGFTASIAIRAVVPSHGLVEIWKDSIIQDAIDAALGNLNNARAKDQAVEADHSLVQQAYLGLRDVDRDSGLLAAFEIATEGKASEVIVKEMMGELPSRTYPIRKALLFPLGPIPSIIGLLFDVIYNFISPIFPILMMLGLIYAGIVVAFWRYHGYPNFREWSADFWMTSWMRCGARRKLARMRDIWGPAGPVASRYRNNGFGNEEEIVGLQRPHSVKLGHHWKR